MSKAKRGWVAAGFLGATILVTMAARPVADRTSDAEMARLRSHFATVLRELREADASRLSSAQLSARSEMIRRLEAYAASGRFPHNHILAGRYTPVFRDEHGTLCAMGFLIASTGRDDIVNDVVRSANLARIPELAADPRLGAWLDSTGLTVGEAARIQPQYDGDGCRGCIDPPPVQPTTHTEIRVNPVYYVGSAGISALNTVATALNLMSTSATTARRSSAVGFIAGATQVVLGAFVLDQPATPRAVGVANMVIGGASVGTALWRAWKLKASEVVAARAVSLAPIVSRGSAGLMLAAKL
jgi:hypothetical protein